MMSVKSKNIHVLPTDKPSRLCKDENNRIWLSINFYYGINDNNKQNIYITSNKEIKEGDWTLMFDDFENLFLCDKPQQYLGIEKVHHLNKGLRKIILTTDQDLIKDGVQAIDDEFLEWFVKNPSCEWVEIERHSREVGSHNGGIVIEYVLYEIIIPKEEPNIIDDWLEKNGDPVIHKQVEQEAKELCEQNKISEEELERVICAPINLYSAIKFLFNKFKNK